MVTVPEVITAMRDVIAAVDGVTAAHYPAGKVVKTPLEVVLYWGASDSDTEIGMDMSQRMWQPVVRAQVLTPTKGNTEAEFARIDNILTPIVDAFDTGNGSLGGLVNRCQVVRVRPTLMIDYAGHSYYGAELYFSIKFHRRAGTP